MQQFWSCDPDSPTSGRRLFFFGRCLDLSPIFAILPFMNDPPSTTKFDMSCMAMLPIEFCNQETRLVKALMVRCGSTWTDVLLAVPVTFEAWGSRLVIS